MTSLAASASEGNSSAGRGGEGSFVVIVDDGRKSRSSQVVNSVSVRNSFSTADFSADFDGGGAGGVVGSHTGGGELDLVVGVNVVML